MKPMAPVAANVRLELTPSDSKSDVLPFTPIRYMWAARHSPFREFANASALPFSDYFSSMPSISALTSRMWRYCPIMFCCSRKSVSGQSCFGS